jgi:amidophosphoribosyltransferase
MGEGKERVLEYISSGEGLKEECGLVGVYGHKNAAYLAYICLQALQHRGQESCGIASSDGRDIHDRLRMGLVAGNFERSHLLSINGNGRTLEGYVANGHTRYSTTGASHIKNVQPLLSDTKYGKIAISHNGNITNGEYLKHQLKQRHGGFKATTDSEVIERLIGTSTARTLENAIVDALQQLEGSFSLVISSENALYAARDPHGFMPLSIGYLGNAVVVASETCAHDAVKAKLERDVSPGELIIIDRESFNTRQGYRSEWFVPKDIIKPSFCLFQLVYFARPDSVVNGISVAEVREELGRQAAREHPVDADMVVPVLDSGLYAAIGYSKESGIPLEFAYVRNHFVHRTFMNPVAKDRAGDVNLKLNVIKSKVKGKRVVVVDDSIIRGTTSRNRIADFMDSGAKEVHLRISCPPTKHPCFYGIDFPTEKELIAANKSIEAIRRHVRATSLGYVSMEGALSAAGNVAKGYCTACWTGNYPTKLTDVRKGFVMGVKC